MDFSLSDRDSIFASEVRRWLEAELPREWRRDHLWTDADDPSWHDVARAWQAKLHAGGWAAISWPREHGGRDATPIERWLFDEELDRAGAPRPFANDDIDMIGVAILRHGTDAQRRRFLEPLLSAREVWCQGFSEPGAGSDLAGLRTRAERRGDEFVVSGQKVWTSYADKADWCFLLCRTEPQAPKHKALSLLLVDIRSPGITVRPLRQMTGEVEFCEVFFDSVRVPASSIVGAPGSGWSIAMGILANERGPVWTFGFQRGIRRSFEKTAALARRLGGGRVDDAKLRQRLAQSYVEDEILRFVGYRSLTRMMRRGQPGPESSIEKILGSETDQRLQETAMAVLGPYALLSEGPRAPVGGTSAAAYLYSRANTIMGGTSEIQRNIIAQRVLGLQR
ncbi:MAG: acyl-CoA dehydrogenase family protein [Myxococcota bacterium]